MKKSFTKHFRLILFAGIVVMLFSLTLIGCNKSENVEPNLIPTEGLEFELVESGDDYTFSVVGLGTATDENIVIPATYKGKLVTSIGKSAFRNRKLIKSVVLPYSIARIDEYAFSGCDGLLSIYYTGNIASWCDIWGIGNLMCYGTIEKTLYINGKEIKGDLVIPNKVTVIRNHAFYGCSELTSVTISNDVTSIGYQAFYGCSGLTSVSIPVGVTSIGEGAFGYTGLTNITIAEGNTAYHIVDNCLIAINTKTLIASCINNSIIPSDGSVTRIGDYAFSKCDYLVQAIIPESVRSIGFEAFSCCANLAAFIIPQKYLEVGNSAFYGSGNLTVITFGGTMLTWRVTNSGAMSGTKQVQVCCVDGDIWYEDGSLWK